MFVLTLNKKSTGKILIAAMLFVFFIGIGAGVKNYIFKNQTTSRSASNLKITTTQDMADYILSKGYSVDLQSAKVKQVKIPKKFDAEFENFNSKIMQTDNLSLKKHKNAKVDKWTFDITDYNVQNKTAVAVLLIKKEKLIGAYLLEMPDGTAYPLAQTDTRSDGLA